MNSFKAMVMVFLLLCPAAFMDAKPQDSGQKKDGAGEDREKPGKDKGEGKEQNLVPEEEEITDPTMCAYCKTTGKLVNPFYETYGHLEDEVKFCSWAIEKDKEGCGLPWTPCWRCKNEQLKARAIAEFEKLVKEKKEWLVKRREVDAFLKPRKPLLHLETEHFVWTWNIPKLTFKKRAYREHEALHLFAGLMEQFYAEFQKVHKVKEKDNFNTFHQLFCFERQVIARKACMKYGEQASPNGKVTKQMKPSVFVTWWNKTRMPSEEDLHRDFIHNVTHLLTATYKTWWWLYETGFAYEGSAHWWEVYYYKKATSYCFREVNSLSNWVAGKWESKVKKEVLAGKELSLAEILMLPGGSLTAKQHMYSWSYVDYMMFMDPHKTIDFFDILKQKRPAREAFLEIWKSSVLGFEEKWKEYVKTEYQIQEDDVPLRRRWRR